jgi:hypothetical protein
MGSDRLVFRQNGCEDHPVRVPRGISRGYQRLDRWHRESFANRGLSLAVVSTFLYLSSALFWPLPQGRWDLAVIWPTTAVLIVLGKAANLLRKRHRVSLEK